MGLKDQLKDLVSTFILDSATKTFESDNQSIDEIEELFDTVIHLFEPEPVISESEYQSVYEEGYVAGMKKGAPWASQEQILEATKNHMDQSASNDFGFLTQKLGKKMAFLDGFYWGKSAGDWYSINKKLDKPHQPGNT